MKQIDEYFTPTKLAELKTDLNLPFVPWVKDGGWEVNKHHYQSTKAPAQARQALQVYDAREKLAKLAEMIEGLKDIEGKVVEIHDFVKDNNLDEMVSFCAWEDPMENISRIMQANLESDAMGWMHSDHSC